MSYKYVSVNTVIAKFIRDYGMMADEADMVEWIGEGLDALGTAISMEEAVAVIEVVNGQADLPNGFHNVIQIGRNNCFNKITATGLCPTDLVSAITTDPTIDPGPAIPVVLDCRGQPITDYDLAYYRPYFDYRWSYDQYRRYVYGNSCFSPIILSNNSLYETIVCKNSDYANSNNSSLGEDTYTVIHNSILRFSFQEGQIAMSYLRHIVDETTGYPMIPDDYSSKTAITYYIMFRLTSRDFYNGREGAKGKMDDAESKWQWYCGQAANNSIMPKTTDEYENILRQRNYIIPRVNAYNNFFGKLSKGDDRTYNNPDGRLSMMRGIY